MNMAQEWERDQAALSAEELDNKIHTLTAIQLLRQLEEPDASPGLIQCALRFLKDNDVTSLPIPGSALDRIAKKLSLPKPYLRMEDAGTETEAPRSDD